MPPTEMCMLASEKLVYLRLGKERGTVMRSDILKGLFSDQERNEALHFKRDFQLRILIGPHF